MADYEVRLLRQEHVAEDTLAVYFSKPDGYTYRAGQAARFVIARPVAPNGCDLSHIFSFASAPQATELMIATRVRDSPFKRSLRSAPPGTVFYIGDAGGALVLPRDAGRPLVFLAGGIGITPFLSMLSSLTPDASQRGIFLFYANHCAARAAFLPELRTLATRLPNFRLVATTSDTVGPALTEPGARGGIRRELLARYLPDLANPLYYVAGPPAMTTAMIELLEDGGVPDASIRSAEFYGY